MAGNFLLSTWKVIHAKFVKPVDNALDSFSMLMLQWMLGTYNIWDVLRITYNVLVSACCYVASVIRHPSILWTEAPPVEETEADAPAGEEADSQPEADNESRPNCTDQEKDFEELSAGALTEAGTQQHQQQQLVTPDGDSTAQTQSVRHRVQPAAMSELLGTDMVEKAA